MASTKWQAPPLIEAVLRLQKLGADLKRIELERRLERAAKLLEQQVRQAKRNG